MAFFQYFVHHTSGMVANIHSCMNNRPIAGFYLLQAAIDYAEWKKCKRNFTAVYDIDGNLSYRITPGV